MRHHYSTFYLAGTVEKGYLPTMFEIYGLAILRINLHAQGRIRAEAGRIVK
jgi:hypothetical protein